ncbi:MAG TPA: hypothetical protein DDY17_05845 [Syntrophaceae bacterium]|jgi:hypothetical protein|nr:hypothetical protein [Syntrophaceae bacterium]
MRNITLVASGLALLIFAFATSQGSDLVAFAGLAGGPCTYDGYPGQAKITRIEMTGQSKGQANVVGGPGYEGYEIWFSFVTDKEIKQDWAKEALKKEHLLKLSNSWYPGEKYLKKYGLEKGKLLRCTLKVITSGTCTPVIFEFDEVNTIDYFETKLLK